MPLPRRCDSLYRCRAIHHQQGLPHGSCVCSCHRGTPRQLDCRWALAPCFYTVLFLTIITGAVNQVNPWSGALDVPLSLNGVYSLAAPFIKSCPSSNPPLPVKAFPSLTFPAGSKPGQKVILTFDKGNSTSDLFVAFYTGLSQEFAPVAQDKSVTIPKDLIGTVYAVVSTNGTMATDATTVAGPAILTFNYNSQGMIIQ